MTEPRDTDGRSTTRRHALWTGVAYAVLAAVVFGGFFHALLRQQDNYLAFVFTLAFLALGYLAARERRRQSLLAEELHESRRRHNLAVSSGDVWDLDLRNGTGQMSANFKRALGYEESEVENSVAALEALLHPEDRPRLQRAINDHLKGIAPYELEFRARAKAGDWRWFATRGQAARDETGKAVYLAGTTFDITERKRAEDALRGADAKLRDLIDGLGAEMFVGLMTPEGVVVEANRPALAAAGLAPEDVIGHPVEQTYWFAYSEQVQRQLRAAVQRAADGQGSRFDVRIRVADSRLIWVDFSLQPLRDHQGKVTFLAPSAMVIDDRKRAEQAVRDSEENFRQLAENIREVFWLTDPEKDTMLYVSPIYESIWGRTRDSLYASPRAWLEAIHPADRERVLAAAHAKQIGGTYDEEYRVVRPDGTLRWVRDRAFPVRDASGAIYRIAGVAEDITARKQAEALESGQKSVLKMIAERAPLGETLDALVRLIEGQADGMLGSILLLDADGKHLLHGAAPSLPDEFSKAIDGEPIGENAGSCGTAAYLGAQVIVEDIANDRRWEKYRDAALAHGLLACWSTPVFDEQRRVLGTFALYFRSVRAPAEEQLRLIELATDTAAIAIARHREEQALRRSEAALRDNEEQLRLFVEHAPAAIAMFDTDMRYIAFSRRWLADYGLGDRNVRGRSHYEIFPDLPERWKEIHRRCLAGAVESAAEDPFPRADGTLDWVRWEIRPWHDASGGVRGLVLFSEVITERKRAEQAQRETEERYRRLVELSPDAIYVVRERKIVFANASAIQMFGARNPGELIGRNVLDLTHPDYRGAAMQRLRALETNQVSNPRMEQIFLRLDGTPVHVEVVSVGLELDGGVAVQVVARDIGERKRAEARIEHLATHDGLTDLPNRNLIHDRITQAIAHARRGSRQLAVLYLDLDRFKVINDGFGHLFGDAVLRAAGERLQTLVRDGDTVARHGGDEFLVLLADLRKSADAYIVTQKVLEALARPFTLEGREIHLTISIGVSIFPQDGQTADALIGNADVAMYRAKDLGRNTYQFFTREMSDETQRRVDLENKLRVAIAGNQLHLAYQPKVDLHTGRITGCEALLRWNHPELGGVSPARFIPVAEDSGLIVPIGDWVLRTACVQNKAWSDAGLAPIAVAVNISARQFLQQDVIGWVTRTLKETGLAPEQLELELTESLIAQDVEKVIATVNELKAAGVRLSIDDFGTGYSSLSYLKRFRVDTLKIDQSFVRNMLTDPDDATIALAVISLAHALRMKAVAEGVETAEHAKFLGLNRCDEMQGYYFSRPVPAAEMEAMLRSGKRMSAE